MLLEDATIAMPPMALWCSGRDAIAIFLATQALLKERWRFVPVRANGQLAFGTYSWDAEKGRYIASAVDVLTLRGDKVQAITAFIGPGIFRGFTVIVSVLVFGTLFGIIGAIIGVPIAAAIEIILDEATDSRRARIAAADAAAGQ
jgi:hypothetical protein